jgi:fucose permease
VLFLYVLTEASVIVYGNAYLQTVHQAPERWAIGFISLFWFGMMLGRLACAAIPERVPYAPLIASLLVVTAATLVLQQWADGWRSSLVLLTLTGVMLSGIWPLIVGMAATLNTGYSATVLGVTIAVGSLGCVVAPTLMNTLFAYAPARAIFPIIAFPLLLAALVLMITKYQEEDGPKEESDMQKRRNGKPV